MSRLLQLLGVLAVLVWTGAGIAAWVLVKDRVQVTVLSDAGARAADDADALLADQITALRDELRALASGVGQNFERLGQTLLDDAAARAAQLAAVVREPGAQAERDAALRAELAAIRESLQVCSAQSAALRSAAPPVAAEPAAVPPPAPGTAPHAAESSPATVPVPAEPPPRRSFLAVPLQTAPVRFDERRTWELLPALSRVGFDATSTLHDFTGVTSRLDGRLTFVLGDAERGIDAEIHVAATALETGLPGRDTAMAEHLAATQHPQISFTASAFKVGNADAGHMTLAGTVSGKMKIRGVERDVEMPVQMAVDASQRLTITGEMPLKMSDYGVPVPSQLGIVNVTDQVKVWIALRARALPLAAAEVRR